MLEARAVTAGYTPGRPVVHDIDLTVPAGAAVGLAGPSGCGKSTLARVLALLHPPEAGEVYVDGEPVTGWRHRAPRALRARIGVLFQQPRLAVDPRLKLVDIVAEPLRASGLRGQVAARVPELTARVGLTSELLRRQPHEVSDGQLQRACLARALILRPRYLVCDEMTSMLDASTTAALVGAVEDIRRETGAGLLAITHDETLLHHWCDATTHLSSQ